MTDPGVEKDMRIDPRAPQVLDAYADRDAIHVHLRSRKGVCAARLGVLDTHLNATDVVIDGDDQILRYRLGAAGHFHGRTLDFDDKPVRFSIDLFQMSYGMIVQWACGEDFRQVDAPDVGVRFASVDELKKLSARRLLQLRDECYGNDWRIADGIVIQGLPGPVVAKLDAILVTLNDKPHVPNKVEARARRQEAARTHRRVP